MIDDPIAHEASDSTCLGCGLPYREAFLDLGETPLANSYLPVDSPKDLELTFPLALAYCPSCHLVQLTDVVKPETLFSDYAYFSSYSDIQLSHARAMAGDLTSAFDLGPSSRVLEIASNDGYLLQYFKQHDIAVLGVEPARNIAVEAQRRGIPTLNKFFGPEVVDEIVALFGRPDLIVGNNVLAHIPDINAFLRAASDCLAPGGVAVFEVPHLKELLERTEFDTIYHEHVFYYSLHALNGLAARNELELFDVSREDIHGGSLRVFFQHVGTRPVTSAVETMLAEEDAIGLTTAEFYSSFGRSVVEVKRRLVAMLRELKASGKSLAAYGAPAKGNTLLNYCGIGTELLDFTCDRSPHKQGKLLPGSHLPILAPQALIEARPDYTLILPWNLVDEIVGQQQEYLAAGGQFIVAIPEPRILGPTEHPAHGSVGSAHR